MQMVGGMPVGIVVSHLRERLEMLDSSLPDRCGVVDTNDSYENLFSGSLKLGGTSNGVGVFCPLENTEAKSDYPESYDNNGDPILVPYIAAVEDAYFDTFVCQVEWDELSVEFAWDDTHRVFIPDRLVPNKGRFQRFSPDLVLPHTINTGLSSYMGGYKAEVATQTGFQEGAVTDVLDWILANTKGRWNFFGSKPDDDTFAQLGVGF